MNTKEDQTPPAARPTPITDALSEDLYAQPFDISYVRMRKNALDLERQLAEERKSLEAQREVIALQYGEIDKLRGKLAKSEHEIKRLRAAVDDANIAELHRSLADARKELAETDKDYQCLANRLDGHDATECRMNLDRLIAQLAECTSECEEQARLLGMSGEREARLIAERDEARDELRKLKVENDHNWQANEMAETAFKERDEARAERDALANACKKLMVVVGPPNATIEQCWASVDEIDEAWETGKSALAAVKGGSHE